MNLFLLVWFLRLCGTLGARGDGGGRSGQDGFSTLFNPAIPWIPNHTMQKQNILCHTSAPYIITYQFHIMQHIAPANDSSEGATKLYIEVFIWIWAVRCSTMVSVLRPLKASTSSSGTSVSMTFSYGLVWFEILQNFTWQGVWSTHSISAKNRAPGIVYNVKKSLLLVTLR